VLVVAVVEDLVQVLLVVQVVAVLEQQEAELAVMELLIQAVAVAVQVQQILVGLAVQA
jgi:hypothetical protein